MPEILISTGFYDFEGFGYVYVKLYATARSIKARWCDQHLLVTAPKGISCDRVLKALRSMKSTLDRQRPEQMYTIGQSWQFEHFSIRLAKQNKHPEYVTLGRVGNDYTLGVHTDIDLSQPSGCDAVNRAICHVAQRYSKALELRGREVATLLGVKPSRWEISTGKRTLGHCSANGVVALSYVLLLYPPQLRDAVICHELAHLRVMNHSAAFHAVCNEYCLKVTGRSEADTSDELRRYKPPIVK